MRWLAYSLCLLLFVAVVAPPGAAKERPHKRPYDQTTDDTETKKPINPDPQSAAKPKLIRTQITEIRTGWNEEQFGIVTVAPIVDTGCPTLDGYVTDDDQPGYHTYYAAALLAYAERATVIVVVAGQGCIANRPKLIGLSGHSALSGALHAEEPGCALNQPRLIDLSIVR